MKIQNALNNVKVACLHPHIIFIANGIIERIILLIFCSVFTRNTCFKNFRP